MGRILSEEGILPFFEFAMDRALVPWHPALEGHIVHLGPGVKTVAAQTHVFEYPDFDFDGAASQGPDSIPLGDDSVGAIYATHFLEHLRDPIHIIREASRVLRQGAPFNIAVPYAGTQLALQDLDHKANFVLDTWKNLLSNPYYTKARGGIHLRVGFNAIMAVKDGNVVILTQLIKDRW